jgi:Rieske Fe-S protein
VSTAVSFVYPIWRYLIPPIVTEATTDSVVAGKVTAFKNGSGTIVKFGSKPAILVRTAQGEFRAFLAVCTHLDCTVQFKADTSQLWCACHNGLYDLRGNNVSGPPPRSARVLHGEPPGEPGQEDVVVNKA